MKGHQGNRMEYPDRTRKVLVPIADGSEEVEAVTIIDILRRAGAEVTVASVDALQITTSRNVRILADCLIGECRDEEYDLVALPGGIPGAEHLRDSEDLTYILHKQHESGRLYGAICASPAVVLHYHGLLKSRCATTHPYFVEYLDNRVCVESRVVIDKNCVTSRGVGTALEFALQLVELLYDREKRIEVADPLVIT